MRYQERFRDFERYYRDQLQTLVDAAETVARVVSGVLKDSEEDIPIHDVSARVKTFDSCVEKYNRKYRPQLEEAERDHEIRGTISDLIGARVVCLYEDDIRKVADRLRLAFEIVNETDKIGHIASFSDRFGYRALHYDLNVAGKGGALSQYRLLADLRIEVQIRSVFQDAWSVIDHQLKYKREVDTALAGRINIFAALCELADQEFVRIRDQIARAPFTSDLPDVNREVAEAPLVLRGFLELLKEAFPGEPVRAEQADSLLFNIQMMHPGISYRYLSDMFGRHGEAMAACYERYMQRRKRRLSPLTRVRVLLRAADDARFAGIVTSEDLSVLSDEVKDASSSLT